MIIIPFFSSCVLLVFIGKIYLVLITNTAAVAELVDALDSKSSGE